MHSVGDGSGGLVALRRVLSRLIFITREFVRSSKRGDLSSIGSSATCGLAFADISHEKRSQNPQ